MLKVLQRSWCPAGCAPNPNSNPNPGSTVAAHCVGSKALFSSAAAGVAGVKSATGFSSSGFSCIRRLCRLRARHAAQARAAVGRGARPGCVRVCVRVPGVCTCCGWGGWHLRGRRCCRARDRVAPVSEYAEEAPSSASSSRALPKTIVCDRCSDGDEAQVVGDTGGKTRNTFIFSRARAL